jgi:hypothetical protein
MATTHTRRTPEQIVADFEAKIAAVKARSAAKEAKASRRAPRSWSLPAARALQKAQVASKASKDQPMNRVLETALAALSAHGVEAGLRMPQPRISKSAAGPREDHGGVRLLSVTEEPRDEPKGAVYDRRCSGFGRCAPIFLLFRRAVTARTGRPRLSCLCAATLLAALGGIQLLQSFPVRAST